MVLCTAVSLAENKSFAFLDYFFLGDRWMVSDSSQTAGSGKAVQRGGDGE